jgi:hypothetical protein
MDLTHGRWDRAKLGGENIEKTECLENWNKNGFTRDLAGGDSLFD